MQRTAEEGICLLSNIQPCWRIAMPFRTGPSRAAYTTVAQRDEAQLDGRNSES